MSTEGRSSIAGRHASRGEPSAWDLLIDPQSGLSVSAAWTLGSLAVAAGIVLGRLGVRFDGALDLHTAGLQVPWGVVLLDAGNSLAVAATVLWAVALIKAPQTRWLDVVLSVAVARLPYVGSAVVALILEPHQEAFLANLRAGMPPDPYFAGLGLLMSLFFFWSVGLLFAGFRRSTGLSGGSCLLWFVVGLATAELATKLLLAGIAVAS